MQVNAHGNAALVDGTQKIHGNSAQAHGAQKAHGQNAHQGGGPFRMAQTMDPVAQLFGETTTELLNDLNTGQTSLSAYADSKGVAQTDLLDAIKQGLQSWSPNGKHFLTDPALTNIATAIANRMHGGGVAPTTAPSGAAGAGGVGTDTDGDDDAGTTDAPGATGAGNAADPAAALKLDIERLLVDLQALQSSVAANGAGTPPPDATGSGTSNIWSSAAITDLVNRLSQVDQAL
jgi:hypothetical protein